MGSPVSGAGHRRKKKKKKDKKDKEKTRRGEVDSASHWRATSPTPFSRTEAAASAAPSHWKGTRPSATPGDRDTHAPSESAEPPPRKKAKPAKASGLRMEMVSPCTGSPTPQREAAAASE